MVNLLNESISESRTPLFSLITVCFNSRYVLRQTIDSVLGQTFSDFEYIIVDGGSTDGTAEILKNYSGRMRFISEHDRGIYHACNKGLRMARGRYVNFLMAGDIHDRDFLQVARSHLREGVDFTYGGVVAKTSSGKLISSIPETVNDISHIFGMPFAHPSLVVTTEAARAIGYNEKLRYAADLEFVCQLFSKGLVGVNTRRALSTYEMGGIGNSMHSIWESWLVLNKFRGISWRVLYVTVKQLIFTAAIRAGFV